MASENFDYLEIVDQVRTEHETLTQNLLQLNPGTSKSVASLRAARVMLRSERESYCTTDMLCLSI